MQVIYSICLTVFMVAAVETGLDAFYPGKFFSYYQFVSLFSLIIAAGIMVLGLDVLKNSIFSDSFMWAGIFIITYGVAIIFADENARFRFMVLVFGLGITIFTGYLKFSNETSVNQKKQKKIDPLF